MIYQLGKSFVYFLNRVIFYISYHPVFEIHLRFLYYLLFLFHLLLRWSLILLFSLNFSLSCTLFLLVLFIFPTLNSVLPDWIPGFIIWFFKNKPFNINTKSIEIEKKDQ